ncbi:hypothetical protein [Superficieibacter electus]|nr:hypothetical protein [Superficieibacter electus]
MKKEAEKEEDEFFTYHALWRDAVIIMPIKKALPHAEERLLKQAVN